MDKKKFTKPFCQDSVPPYKCPHCSAGVLRLDGKFYSRETETTKIEKSEVWWDPDHSRSLFTGTLICSVCNEIVFVVGDAFLDFHVETNGWRECDQVWSERYKPLFFHPPIPLINIPLATPEDIIKQMKIAFSLFFNNADACCNSIRAAGELLLTELGIKKEKAGGGWLSFSSRIGFLPEEREAIKGFFNAIRWLGNSGSHSGKQNSHEDALDSLIIIEHLLDEIYGDHRQKVEALAAEINQQKGPVGNRQNGISSSNES